SALALCRAHVDNPLIFKLFQYFSIVFVNVRRINAVCFIDLDEIHLPPCKGSEETLLEFAEGLGQREQQRHRRICWRICERGNTFIMGGAFSSHDTFHNRISTEMLRNENQLMRCPSSCCILECERK